MHVCAFIYIHINICGTNTYIILTQILLVTALYSSIFISNAYKKNY